MSSEWGWGDVSKKRQSWVTFWKSRDESGARQWRCWKEAHGEVFEG